MNEVSDEAGQNIALVITTEDQPVVLSPGEEETLPQECEYCGHLPCACGG